MSVLEKVPKDKIGKINSNGVKLEAHEYDTILLLALYGLDIEFIKPSNTPKSTSPDIFMLGGTWEMKSPNGKSQDCIERCFRKAAKQSDRIIIDMRRLNFSRKEAEKEIIKNFTTYRRLKRMILVRSEDEVVDYSK